MGELFEELVRKFTRKGVGGKDLGEDERLIFCCRLKKLSELICSCDFVRLQTVGFSNDGEDGLIKEVILENR